MSLGSILLSEWVMNFLVGKLVGVTREGGEYQCSPILIYGITKMDVYMMMNVQSEDYTNLSAVSS
jgi:hypothetical protein